MYTVLLVSEQRLKQWTNLDDNVRVEEITPFIIQSQDIYIQNLCGTLLFNRLKDGVLANDLNVNETILLQDYVAPALMQYALYMLMPGLKYNLLDKGILSGTSEESSGINLDELKYLRQSVLNTAEFYSKRLREYFIDNPGMFPEYSQPGTNGMYPDKANPYFSGLQIPRGYRDNYDECDNCFGMYGPDAPTN